jgi:hypothetical protein
MAELDEISVDADGIPSAGGTDTVPTLTQVRERLGSLTETAPADDTASSGLNGRLQRIAQRISALILLVPTSLGAKNSAGSFSVTTSTDDLALTRMGSLTETAPADDTASSGLNGRLQRIAQRITSLIALVPTSLGAKTAANSFSVTVATDDLALARYGALTETAPASDTASSGLNGRLQRIAQNISTLITSIAEVAHDAADSGNPSKIGGYASAAVPTAVTAAADRVNGWFTLEGAQAVVPLPHTHGGCDIFRSLDLDETEEAVKATAGCLYKLRITNRTTAARYVKLYNATTANTTVGTTTPIDTIVVPASGGSADLATVITENFGGVGMTFGTALSIAATTGCADNDTGAPGANDVIVTAYYK